MTNTTTSTVLSPGLPVAGQVRVKYEAGSFLAFFDELGQCLGRKPWAETGIPDDADYVAFLLARYGTLAAAKRVLIDGDCAACVEESKCPRCDEKFALTEDGEGPCRVCGWNFDDACPRH